jgi:hypothetical protein
MKAGFKTTEFWSTVTMIATNIVAMLAVLGYVKPGDTGEITEAVTGGITSLGAFVANAMIVWRYIASREKAKEKDAEVEMYRIQISANAAGLNVQGKPDDK